MKKDSYDPSHAGKSIDIINISESLHLGQKKVIRRFIDRLRICSYNLCTGFPQNLWKTRGKAAFLHCLTILLCCLMLASCSFFKSSKKDAKPAEQPAAAESKKTEVPREVKVQPAPEPKGQPANPQPKKGFFSFLKGDDKKPFLDSSLIDQGEDEVKKSFGEPDIVAKTPENMIIWTYKPKWKLIPDNADTVYVEFEKGKVRKIVRATR